ncbi:protein of unknown function [Paenibacillus alvei]|uniref:Uncharacterized protein n=1 Tax=Paenibacillus alvei TaxID=44250 RepID=A0A383RBS3_PAEAL|nr:protein of unknown function [Paenibacillus alvei]
MNDFGVLTSQKVIILQSFTPMKMFSVMLANIFTTTTITATQNVWMAYHLMNTDELHNKDNSALLIRTELSKLTIFVFYTVHLTGSISASLGSFDHEELTPIRLM